MSRDEPLGGGAALEAAMPLRPRQGVIQLVQHTAHVRE